MSQSDLVENEVKNTTTDVVESAEKKDQAPSENVVAEKRKHFIKQHNVIIVRKTANFKTLVI